MPRCVIYGPRSLGGRQLTNLQIEQPAKNINTTLGYLRRGDKVAMMFTVTVRDLQLEVGVSKPFYDLDPSKNAYVTQKTRWRYTWEIIHELKLTVTITIFWVARSKYADDKNIMDIAVRDQAYTGKNKYKLNTIS